MNSRFAFPTLIVLVLAITGGGCRPSVPDEAWARRVFNENASAIDLLASKVEEAVGELPPVTPPENDDYKTRMKFYEDLKARCDTLKTKVVTEIKKQGNIVEWQNPFHVTGAPPNTPVPCQIPYSYSPREERFGDIPPEKGFVVGRWQVGRRLKEIGGKKQPAIEVLSGAIIGGLTLEMRWLLVEKK